MTTPVRLRGGAVAIGGRPVLRGIDLTVESGDFLALMGANGSGKSTLVRGLTGLLPLTAGSLELFGTPFETFEDWRRIGFVPQRSSHATFPHLRAVDQLRQIAGWRGASRTDNPADALAAVGLEHRGDHLPLALSGGEQQRLAVALALVGRPALIVADEPTAELDHANADVVVDALLAAATAGAAVVISSHDERIMHRADRLLRLRHGVLSSETTRRDTTGVIDATGRLQLPPAVLDLFPSRRVIVEIGADGVRLRAPEEES